MIYINYYVAERTIMCASNHRLFIIIVANHAIRNAIAICDKGIFQSTNYCTYIGVYFVLLQNINLM